MNNVAKSGLEASSDQAVTPLLSSIVSALSTEATDFTGERFVFGSGVEIFYEHYHRYVFAARHISPEQTVLDLGCGVGYGSLLLATKAKEVVALDRDEDSITLLRSLLGASDIKNVKAVCGGVDEVEKLITGPIDVVVCHELIEHLPRDMQERLLAKISAGEAPFHKGTRLFISTPERVAYNARNSEENHFHEFEFSQGEFASFLSRQFSHHQMLRQGSVTGNLMVSATGGKSACSAGFVHWQDVVKLLGTVTDSPDSSGIYMYGVASNSPIPPMESSVLLDQRERLIAEKLAIAAKELNEKQREVTRVRERLASRELSEEFQEQAQQKIKALLRENEILAAHLGGVDIPLEVKLAMKVMQRMPKVIRVVIRRMTAFAIAIRRG